MKKFGASLDRGGFREKKLPLNARFRGSGFILSYDKLV
jgi:hypothetical protein